MTREITFEEAQQLVEQWIREHDKTPPDYKFVFSEIWTRSYGWVFYEQPADGGLYYFVQKTGEMTTIPGLIVCSLYSFSIEMFLKGWELEHKLTQPPLSLSELEAKQYRRVADMCLVTLLLDGAREFRLESMQPSEPVRARLFDSCLQKRDGDNWRIVKWFPKFARPSMLLRLKEMADIQPLSYPDTVSQSGSFELTWSSWKKGAVFHVELRTEPAPPTERAYFTITPREAL